MGSTAPDKAAATGRAGRGLGPAGPASPLCAAPRAAPGAFPAAVSATSPAPSRTNGLDSDDESPIEACSAAAAVEVAVDIHCGRARGRGSSGGRHATTAQAAARRGAHPQAGRGRGATRGRDAGTMGAPAGGSVAPQERSHNAIEVAADAHAWCRRRSRTRQARIIPGLEEEVKEMMTRPPAPRRARAGPADCRCDHAALAGPGPAARPPPAAAPPRPKAPPPAAGAFCWLIKKIIITSLQVMLYPYSFNLLTSSPNVSDV